MNTQHNHFYDAEITRMRGEVLLAQSHSNAGEAEAAFAQAMAIAQRQSCRALELRAGICLARLLADDGRGAEARGLLAPLFGAYTEGFEQRDLQAAKALLAELG
jgi:predicted ATPase